jgi:predicted nucleotide-binding protein
MTMPSATFKVIDKRYLINAYADNTTHATMSAYESGLGFTSVGNNKIERATSTINYLFEQPDTDGLILDMLNHLFVENPYADTSPANESFDNLRRNVLYRRGVILTDDGFVMKPPVLEQPPTERTQGSPAHPGLANITDGLKVIADHSAKYNFNLGTAAAPRPPEPLGSNKTVFVVHGRDMRPVEQIETFLLFLGLTMMSWSDAVKLTGDPQPHTYDIVKAGMDHASAIVVVFSPDDEARVKRHFASGTETGTLTGQARQNVLVEAGMAFAQSRQKTIFVQSEPTRPITDLEGFNWVKLNGEWDSRQDFINRLEGAGADPKPMHPQLNHRTAGEFKIA